MSEVCEVAGEAGEGVDRFGGDLLDDNEGEDDEDDAEFAGN